MGYCKIDGTALYTCPDCNGSGKRDIAGNKCITCNGHRELCHVHGSEHGNAFSPRQGSPGTIRTGKSILLMILSLFFIPLIYFYGTALWDMVQQISLNDSFQFVFWIALGISAVMFFIFLGSGSFISIFEHELTHNLWAVLTFNKPVGFHVRKNEGGLFEYQGKGNFLITLSPYFFLTVPFLALPFYLIIKEDFYYYYFLALGIFTGYHISSTLKETHFRQPDLKANGYFVSFVVIILGNVLNYGLIIAFTIGRWGEMGKFLRNGLVNFGGFVMDLVDKFM